MNNHNADPFLECPVCLELFSSPVYQCHGGHLICNNCINNLRLCPVCRRRLPDAKIRNLAVEEIISEQTFGCIYRSKGCNVKLREGEFLTHTRNCIFALRISCRYLGLKCEEALTSGELLDHLITHHGLIAHAMETTEVCQKFQRDHLIEVVNSSKEWDPLLLITAGRVMFLRTVAENGHIVWRLFLIHETGDHAVVPKIELTVLNKNKKSKSPLLTWRGPLIRMNDLNQPCLTAPAEYIADVSEWRLRMKFIKDESENYTADRYEKIHSRFEGKSRPEVFDEATQSEGGQPDVLYLLFIFVLVWAYFHSGI